MVSELTIAKDFMEDAVQNRKMFQEFLQTVVESDEARSRYKDIRELIRRCETLGGFRLILHSNAQYYLVAVVLKIKDTIQAWVSITDFSQS